ncbi:MAG: acyl-CoA dehydrogenase family protein [Muribaculaceae bacterium]|nr:acyl-CoA dehydrogenase family protein [Muribaculaceae bacterium]
MANFYKDNKALQYHLRHPLMEKVVGMKERDYTQSQEYDYAPVDYEDAIDSYDKILEITGEITAETIAPNAESVDKEGPHHANGRVDYASKTQENLDVTRKAGLYGVSMPRKYGGLNLPNVTFSMMSEMIAQADAGFQNIWSLQSCIDTLFEAGDEDQFERYIPRVCNGETMSMDLTEPDAGSDLQSVMLKATEDDDGTWRLNGVKRFITNGDSDIHLVLARSEEGSKDGRGLSMFIYDKRNGGVNVRRIEDKMGIHGSPTCELVFKNAKAELCGSRRLGLIKYVMSLMNGARLGITAQSVGLCQAAYNEALDYARSREQFGQAIITFPAVAEMLTNIKAKLDAARTILYETARFVDVYKIWEQISRERQLTPEERAEMKRYNRLADAFTPLSKASSSEYANQTAYDCIQIHGGSGFMRDYTCERLYRDARIMNIYEGTTQLQVVAAIRHVTTGTYLAQMKEYAQGQYSDDMASLKARIDKMMAAYEEAVEKVKSFDNSDYITFHARRMVEMAAWTIMSYLLCYDASKAPELFKQSAEAYVRYAEARLAANVKFINNFTPKEAAIYTQE